MKFVLMLYLLLNNEEIVYFLESRLFIRNIRMWNRCFSFCFGGLYFIRYKFINYL